jgi:hypothetical protein
VSTRSAEHSHDLCEVEAKAVVRVVQCESQDGFGVCEAIGHGAVVAMDDGGGLANRVGGTHGAQDGDQVRATGSDRPVGERVS